MHAAYRLWLSFVRTFERSTWKSCCVADGPPPSPRMRVIMSVAKCGEGAMRSVTPCSSRITRTLSRVVARARARIFSSVSPQRVATMGSGERRRLVCDSARYKGGAALETFGLVH